MHGLTVSLTSCGESSSHLAPCTPLLARVARTRPLQTRHHRRRRGASSQRRRAAADRERVSWDARRPGTCACSCRAASVPSSAGASRRGGRSLPLLGPSSPRSAARDGVRDKGVDSAADADVDVDIVRSEPSLRSRGCPCAVTCAGGHCGALGLPSQVRPACGRYASLDADAWEREREKWYVPFSWRHLLIPASVHPECASRETKDE